MAFGPNASYRSLSIDRIVGPSEPRDEPPREDDGVTDLTFFSGIVPLPLSALAVCGGAAVPQDVDPERRFRAVAALDRAGPADIAMALATDDRRDVSTTMAGACFVTAAEAARLPMGTIALVTQDPAAAFARAAALLHPDSVRPGMIFERMGIDPAAIIHRDARLESGVSVDPGAIVGPRVEIGTGTTIGANTTIAPGVRIGRHCAIDCQVSLSHAFIGDRVIIHTGARIGQTGLGPAATDGPHLGRVIIQNDVEIGANATIARGHLDDTVLGEGCRIGTGVAIDPDARVERVGVRARA